MRPLPTLATVLAVAVGAAAVALASTAGANDTGPVQQAELLGRSVLPALTYVPGSEPSGAFVASANGVTAPFPGQPVQGFSGIQRQADGSYLVMSDNGFGAKANSGDFLLRVHHIQPDLATGTTTVLPDGFGLSDPWGKIEWPIWRDGGCATTTPLPAEYTCPTPDRQLTGWDFDIESMQVAPNGTFWFGDEFGPFLLHTDSTGRLLTAPVPLPGVQSPSNPTLTGTPNLANSKGFEGMAISPDGRTLYPMLEGPIQEDVDAGLPADLRIFEAKPSPSGATYTGRFWRYRMEHPGNAIGDLIAVDANRFLVIERDNGNGPTARFKAIFLIDRRDRDDDGYVDKELVLNLMAVPNPGQVNGITDAFLTFPFVTIEDVEIIDDQTIVVLNDNNFPGGGGRTDGVPDDNELIVVQLDKPLDVDRRLLA